MAAIPYASASSRPVPAFSIPFRSIISSSSFSSSSSSNSGNQRTPSPSATPSTPPLSTSHRHSTYLAPPYFSSATSSNSTSTPAPLSAYDQGRRHSVVLPQEQQQQQQQQQEQEQLQPHPMLYSAGRRSRRAARGPEVSSGGRRTGGRDIDDMTDAELRALDHAEQQGRHFPAPPPPPASAPPVSSTQGMMTSLAGVGGNIAQGRTSDSSDLPAYFVDPSLPQYEYRARPVWSTDYPSEASPPSSSSFYLTDATSTSAGGVAAPSYSYAPSPFAMSSTAGTAVVGPASVRGTPFPSSPPQIQVTASVAGVPSTPERRILGLPNRNSPPVPPRSLPTTTGLSVLRGSSLLAHSAATAAAAAAAAGWSSSSSSSSLGMSGIRDDREDGPGLSMMVNGGASVGRTAVPPPAYEEQDSSARRGSAPLLLGRAQMESTSIDSVATITVGMPSSASVPSMSISSSGSGSGSGSAAAAVGTGTGNAQPPLLVPFVPTRSVSLPGSSLPSVQSAMAATAAVRNRTVLRSSMLTSSPVTMGADEEDVDVDEGVPGLQSRDEEELEMMEEILQSTTTLSSSPVRAVLGVSTSTASPPCSTNTSPRTPTSANIHQAPLPSPPHSATSSALYPSSSSFSPSTTRRPISQLITPFSAVGATPPSPLSGLAWDFGLGYPSASPGSSPSARLSVSNAAFAFGRAQEDVARFGGGGGGGSVAHPPIPSERRSSRAVGRHMRVATSVLSPSPSSSTATTDNNGQSSRPNAAPMTLPRRSASRTRSRTPLSMYEGTSAAAADSTNAAQTQAQAQAAAVALFGLSAREWAMRLAWLGEQEGEGAGSGSAGGTGAGASRRSASVSAL
ncbi:unnamed protein product [Tilletia controversa]|nr:unnamed protein product [Tilletia controversa]